MTVGNGGLYGYKKFDEQGVVVEESTQTWPTEADAEKYLRTVVSTNDKIEVEGIKNINPEANTNVNLVKDKEVDENRDAGMNVVHESIEDKAKKNEESSDASGHQA